MKPDEMTFEQSLARLEQIVKEIEQGQIGLEDSIRRYEEGVALLSRCRSILSHAEMKIQKLQERSGTLEAEPLSE